MRGLRILYELFRPLISYIIVLVGACGAMYYYAAANNRIVAAVCVLAMLAGVVVFIHDEIRDSEFLEQSLGMTQEKKKSKRKKRAGKRCPQCQRLIYHRRQVCQHCGFEFASKRNEEKKDVTNPPEEKEGKS